MDLEKYREIVSLCQEHDVKLIAVSKTRSVEEILELYHVGQRDFGENRIQEWMEKKDALPDDIRWHLIGHLQTNKVKYLSPPPFLVHSGDRLSLLDALDKQAAKQGVRFSVLLQIKIAMEETKYGFEKEELIGWARSGRWKDYPGLTFRGVMSMASFTEDTAQVSREFAELRACFSELKAYFTEPDFQEISMGMSGDYETAIREGSTMVRIGSSIFGPRH